ncbi:MAG: hypothetical protein P1S46_09415 [bacterium]|nr:hypothetical protein [bacterium]
MKKLKFQLTRRDLYEVIRITASRRPLRRIALPGLAGLVLIGHTMDGNYLKGVIWAVAVAGLYWGVSQGMFLLHTYGGNNETLLVPQEIQLFDDRMVVTSEHGTEEFARPEPGSVRPAGSHLLIDTGGGSLVFLKGSFVDPGDYEILRSWLLSGPSGIGVSE